LYDRQPERTDALIHHSDRRSQYVSIRYSERLAEAGIEPSVGSKGDSYDNALAETNNGLYKAELIQRRGPLKTTRNRWNLPRCNGCPGLTTTDCWSPSATFPLPKLRKITIGNSPVKPPQRKDLNQPASAKPGAIHPASWACR
jgi:transposase InsO family protein